MQNLIAAKNTFWAKWILLIALLGIYLGCRGQEMVKLNDQSGDIMVSPSQMEYCKDSSGTIEFEEISARTFKKNSGGNSFEINRVYWFKFTLWNESDPRTNWILQLPLHSEWLNVFIKLPNGSFQAYETGQKLNFYTRSIDLRTLAFELPPDRKVPIEIYIRLFYERYTDLSFILINEKDYIATHTKSYFFLGLIYGILFLMAVYNLILYVSFRERIYVYYVLYILSSAFFISWKDGLGFQFLWPNTPSINAYHHSVSLFLLLTTFLLYANNFLEVRRNHPRIFLITNVIIGINLLYFIITIFDTSYFDPLPLVYICSYVYFLGVTVFYLINKYKPARYLLVSLVCMVLALLVIKLRYLGLIEWSWFVEYILNYAIVIDAIAMSLAISDKLTFLKKQKDDREQAKLKEERLRRENDLIQLKNERLEAELTYQSNQLAVLATSSIQKTEFVHHLKKELEDIAQEIPLNESLKRLIKNMGKEADFDDHWDKFQLNFDRAHHNFLTKLKELYPTLKPSDLMLCAYTKLSKSNKEIASLLNISLSGVEKKRLRLKEKMILDPDQSLSEFLAQLK